MKPNPCRGEVWFADLKPTRGREQDGDRPVLILSVDKFNHGPAELVTILPITSRSRNIPSWVRCECSGLKEPGYIICEQPRCISKSRLRRLCGTVDAKTMLEVAYAVRAILGL